MNEPRVCEECGQPFAPDEKPDEARLDGVDKVFYFHRECFIAAWGYDPGQDEG